MAPVPARWPRSLAQVSARAPRSESVAVVCDRNVRPRSNRGPILRPRNALRDLRHGEDLRQVTGDDELARAVRIDYRTAGLDDKTRQLMDFAVALTRDPASTGAREIEALRAVGWTDAQILTATEVIGFFNYYVRMVEALGVEPEPEMTRDPDVWPDP